MQEILAKTKEFIVPEDIEKIILPLSKEEKMSPLLRNTNPKGGK
jgi:hypothetical protein